MWKFRPIGRYYELLVDDDSIYLCRKRDTIIQAVIEDLCDRHNRAMAAYENLDTDIVSCDEAYLNGLEDGKEYGYANGYDDGYKRGVADALGKDTIE